MIKMRKFYLVLTPFLLLSCGGDPESEVVKEEDTEQIDSAIIFEFETPLRPAQKLFDLSITYFDTVEYFQFAEYDYWYALVVTDQGDTAALATDELMDDVLSGAQLMIEWEVDSLYEAGEGEELYFKERLVSYEVLIPGVDLENQLLGYMLSYTTNNIDALANYTHEIIGTSSAYNPGAACAYGGYEPEIDIEYSQDWIVSTGPLIGDFCEGYIGVSDGLYYEEITEEGLPSYMDMAADEMVQLSIPEKVDIHKIYKVTVVMKEMHWGYLYFVEEDGVLYNLMTDRCDCSA